MTSNNKNKKRENNTIAKLRYALFEKELEELTQRMKIDVVNKTVSMTADSSIVEYNFKIIGVV